jgi:predicted outer membrane repeat protein
VVGSAASGDTIMFNIALPATISLTSGQIVIMSDIMINGPGANLLTISGSNLSRVFQVNVGTLVHISDLTIANGNEGGAGGILTDGNLSVTNCTFSSNHALSNGGAITNNGPLLSVTNCTFNLNSATNEGGGGIANASVGTLSATGCTFSNNTSAFGAGIANIKGSLLVTNCTFSNNTALNPAPFVGGGGIDIDSTAGDTTTLANCTISGNSGVGILVRSANTLNLENTIIADSIGGPDCQSNVVGGVNSHNLIKDGSCSPMLTGNPMLGPLQNNGGPTPTMALLPGSPAIDAGDDSVLGPPLSLTTDQRGPGFTRKFGLHVDIGAFELQPVASSLFDTCLKDYATGNVLQWNSTTGAYKFTRCSDNFMLTGTGTVSVVNAIRMLTDRQPDRRISAGFNTGQLTGSANVYLNTGPGIWQLFRINDTNPSAVCQCQGGFRVGRGKGYEEIDG